MGFILVLIALIILCIIGIPIILFGTIISLIKHEGNLYYKNIAISIDQFGNVLCQYLFNLILITKNGYKFGNIDETISSVLGKNYKLHTLTILGYFLSVKILNSLDKNHIEKSIDISIK